MTDIIAEIGNLTGTITGSATMAAEVEQIRTMDAAIGLPRVVETTYMAGNGIVIDNKVISIDELIIDCGRGTTT